MKKMDIQALLENDGRTWHSVAGASDTELARLATAALPVALPDSLLDLLQYSNGGEGELALPPLYFVLDSVDDIVGSLTDDFLKETFPNFLFFGGNGGLERVAFVLRDNNETAHIVMVDPIAGPDSSEKIAQNIDEFILRLGITPAVEETS